MSIGSEVKEQMPHPYDMHTITEEMRLKAWRELNEDGNSREKCLEELRNQLKGEKNLHFQDEDVFLLQFLRARKFSIQRALSLCKNYYKAINGDLLVTMEYPAVYEALSSGITGLFPYRDNDGCIIGYVAAGKWNPDQFSSVVFAQALMTSTMLCLKSPCTQICGGKLIINASSLSYSKVFSCARNMLLTVYSCLNCFPLRYKELHVINETPALFLFWRLVRGLLSEKLRNRVHFHGDKLEELHKFISPSLLSEECGGALGPFDHTFTLNELKKRKKEFEEMRKYGYKTTH